MTYQFTSFSTTGPPDYRVDGYDQALPDGTPVKKAKSDVLALFPTDTRSLDFRVIRAANSCAVWNLQSKTLGAWFSGKKVGDPQGRMGVVLETIGSNGEPSFRSNDITNAMVNIGPITRSATC